jgi:2,4-dienoyl-CoA reductase [(3E)-enoyl-CoA-producing], peroxisomal
MEIDALGTFNMCRASFEYLKNAGDSLIINITATLHLPMSWYQIHASSAKAAVDAITRNLSVEWDEYNIRVVGIG